MQKAQFHSSLYHDCEQGWPEHIQDFPIKQGQEFVVTSDQNATATPTLLPINHAVRLTVLFSWHQCFNYRVRFNTQAKVQSSSGCYCDAGSHSVVQAAV